MQGVGKQERDSRSGPSLSLVPPTALQVWRQSSSSWLWAGRVRTTQKLEKENPEIIQGIQGCLGTAANNVCYKVPVGWSSRKREQTMGCLRPEPDGSGPGMQTQDSTRGWRLKPLLGGDCHGPECVTREGERARRLRSTNA